MKRKNNIQAYTFLSPFLVLVTILYIFPAVLTVVMAFTDLDKSFIWTFAGLKNFERVFRDPNTLIILKNTAVYVSVCILAVLAIDLMFAVLTTHFIKTERISSFFKGVLMIPMITPAVVYSVLWIWLLGSTSGGALNRLYMFVSGAGSPVHWIAN